MKQFKNCSFFLLLLNIFTTNVFGMEENNKVKQLTENMDGLSLLQKSYTQDHTLYDKLLSLNNTTVISSPSSIEAVMHEMNAFVNNASTDQQRTAFVCALKNLKEEYYIVALLLNDCFNLDFYFQFEEGNMTITATPLLWACAQGHFRLAQELIHKNVTINVKDSLGSTPLMWSIYFENAETASLLLDKNAAVNARNQYGDTALIIACRYKHKEIARRLIKLGANVNIQTASGETPLSIARQHKLTELAELIFANGGIDNHFLLACQQGNCHDIKSMIKAGSDVNITASCGTTPLLLASENNHLKACQILIKHGANVNQANNEGYTPLYLACFNANITLVRTLLKSGAHVNHQFPNTTQLTIQYNNEKKIISTHNWTALAVTCEVVKQAIAADNTDYTDIVLQQRALKLISFLLEKKAILNTELYKRLISSQLNKPLQKLMRNLNDLTIINELLQYSQEIQNKQAENIIRQKIKHVNSALKQHTHQPQPRSSKRGRRRKSAKGANRRRNNKMKKKSAIKTIIDFSTSELEEVADCFDHSYDPITNQITVSQNHSEYIKEIVHSQQYCSLIYNGLVPFGGKKLMITITKNDHPNHKLQELFKHGPDISQRARTGTRKPRSKVRETEEVGEWNVDPATQVNPKMNNPQDPTHAFPEYIEMNFAQWADDVREEKINQQDKQERFPTGRNITNYTHKLVFYIPGILKTINSNGSTDRLMTGWFEYIILVPKGAITPDNRPFCVHRFFTTKKYKK